jgi:general secretion pathway protein G
MLKFSLFILLVSLVTGCSDHSRLAKLAVKAGLVKEDQTQYWFLTGELDGIYCGKWDKNNGVMARTGYRYFIVRGDIVDRQPSRNDWAIFCKEDPVGQLFTRLGIGPVTDRNSSAHKIYRDLVAIGNGLDSYRADIGDFPEAGVNLQQLLSPKNDSEGSVASKYLDDVPVDPWGRPYRYEYSQLRGNIALTYRLYTRGADDADGGTGEDADVGSEHMKYLEPIIKYVDASGS